MMLLLRSNVFQNRWLLRWTHTKSRVTRLPSKCLTAREAFVNPSRGIRFHLIKDFGGGEFRRKHRKDVNMIRRSVDQKRCRTQFTQDAAHIREQSLFKIGFKCRHSVFRAKNEMRQKVGERVSHNSFAPPGLLTLFNPFPRLAPWATF